MAKLGAASPLLIVLLVVSAARNSKFPAVEASYTHHSVVVPQFAVGHGNVIAALLLVVPPVPELADVLPDDCVPAQLASDDVTATRA